MRNIILVLTLSGAMTACWGQPPRAAAPTQTAHKQCLEHQYYGRGDAAISCFEKLVRTNSPWMKAEGLWGLEQYKDANDQFRSALKMFPQDAELRARWGLFFLDRFNSAEAEKLFAEALELDPQNLSALLGMARSFGQHYDQKASTFAQKAAEFHPQAAEPHEVMARLALEDSDRVRAKAEADKALELKKDALEAMGILASMDFLADKKDSPWPQRALQINPHYGQLYETAGHFYVINRRYEEGIQAYREAVKLSPRLFSAHAELGVSLMRLGREGEARKELELCFNNSYATAQVKNTLTLMDSYNRFTTFETPRTILRLDRKEAELMRPYFEAELTRAIETYDRKYKIKLNGPVQLEVYPDHEDFAIRTMGLPGLGALGVTFGNVVAMDSPSGRTPGSFHWASTLWHELSHVYVLSATQHRVPRWFTEGLAVYEETAISPDWGDRLDPEAIKAIRDKKLLPIAELDRGFVRPSYPSQVIVSYFQAGKICEFIVQKWNYDKLLAMMHRFANQTTTAQVVEAELQMKPEEFDKQFLSWLGEQTRKPVEGFPEWEKHFKAANRAAREKRWDDVITEASAMREAYPDYVETGSAYEQLADAYMEKKDKASAVKALEAYSKMGGRTPATLKKLAAWQREAGKNAEAAATLDRINFVYLKDEEMHRQSGELALLAKDSPKAIREFQAAIACGPIDKANAYFNLAQAYRAAGKRKEAQDAVFHSLEAAPGFKPAQRLLLEISQEGATD